MLSDYCLLLVYCHPVANLPLFRRCRALLSSRKMSLYQQRGAAHVLWAGKEPRGLPGVRMGRLQSWRCHVQRLCAFFTQVGGEERGCLPKLVLMLHCGTWPAVVEHRLEQCPLRWGILRVSRVLCRVELLYDITFSRGEGRQDSRRILYTLPPCDSRGRQGTGS